MILCAHQSVGNPPTQLLSHAIIKRQSFGIAVAAHKFQGLGLIGRVEAPVVSESGQHRAEDSHAVGTELISIGSIPAAVDAVFH